MLFIFLQGWGAGQFLPAPAPDFFFQAAPAPRCFSSGFGSGSKEPKTPGSDLLRLPSPELKTLIEGSPVPQADEFVGDEPQNDEGIYKYKNLMNEGRTNEELFYAWICIFNLIFLDVVDFLEDNVNVEFKNYRRYCSTANYSEED